MSALDPINVPTAENFRHFPVALHRLRSTCDKLRVKRLLPLIEHELQTAPVASGACNKATERTTVGRSPCFGFILRALALEQLQHALGQLVSLGQHGGACLLQNLSASQIGGLCSEVGITDP